jgi:uncharacterized membrane protein
MSAIPPPSTPPPPGGGSYTPPPPPPPGGPVAGGSDRMLMMVLSYIWLLFLIPLLTKKDDSEVQWHAKNGMALTIVEVLAWIVVGIAGAMMRATVGCGPVGLSCIVWVAFLVFRILAIVSASKGQRFRFPMITDWAEKM